MQFLVMFALSEDYNDFILDEVNVLLEMEGLIPHETYDMCEKFGLDFASQLFHWLLCAQFCSQDEFGHLTIPNRESF